MLERMDDFFNSRLEGYEDHQLHTIEGACEFYPFTARLLPMQKGANVLDLGCGTGLELTYYFQLNPTARITGIDLAKDMLNTLKEKFFDKDLVLIQASYFDVLFEKNRYDAVVSIESLHHFTKEKKESLYKKIYQALAINGYFILTDYFATTEEEEIFFRHELIRLKEEQGIKDDALYHFDIPLTVEHEIEALQKAGFSHIEILGKWKATYVLKAVK